MGFGGVTKKKLALKGGHLKKYKKREREGGGGHVKYFSNTLRWDMFHYS